MESVAMQKLDTTANYFSTCEPENRKGVKETGKELGGKHLIVKHRFSGTS